MSNDGAERTEEATPRRRTKERQRGNIPKSKDMESAMVMIGGLALLGVLSKYMYTNLLAMMQHTFTNLNPYSIDTSSIVGLLYPYFRYLGIIVLPFFVLLFILAIFVIRMDIGHVFALERAKFNLENLSPKRLIQNAKRLINPFQPRTLVEFAKSILKIIIVGACGYSAINSRKGDLLGLVGLETPLALSIVGSVLMNMIINMCIAMLILGFLDKKYQTYEYNKSIKMTKQEVKDEHKDIEGDPKIKARIKSIQMQMARQRMMSAVPQADVVVTNPTHYAVALKYDKTKAPVPVVVAKGIDYLAFQIRDIAKNHNVPIVENRPVARALYNSVPVDGMIPSELYVAVAQILNYVYNSNREN
ncbi:MAG: flagellar biosynthesis protein FlhB [Cyanobacteria bacterium SIG28]|nr:flagellar biosynthesis protein FlhB [Cyanobacteria bacterium SIG28]